MPVWKGVFSHRQRKFKVDWNDGWYWVKYADAGILEARKLSLLEIQMVSQKWKCYLGYLVNNGFYFAQPAQEKEFNRAKADVSAVFRSYPVRFWQGLDTWQEVRVCERDGDLYFVQTEMPSALFLQVYGRYQNQERIDSIPGLTPALRNLFWVTCLQDQFLQEQAEQSARERFSQTLEGRIRNALELGGAEYISHRQVGQRLNVFWRVGGVQFDSVVDLNLRGVELGFCLSGEDQKHTLVSAPILAREYIQNDELVILRR